MRACVRVYVRVYIRSSLHSVLFGQLLRFAHQRIVDRIKVYIERNNMQVELIRLSKNIAFIHLGSLMNTEVSCMPEVNQ